MPYSSGTFSRVHDFTDDRDNGIRIQASRMDAEMDGIATGLSTALLKDGTQTATAKIPFAVGLSVIDNQTILLGTNSDIAIQYDETTNDSLEISANVEGAALGIVLKSDQGDDNADQHKLSIADGGTLTLGSKISGSFVSYLTHTPNSTVASSTLAVAGNLTVGGNLTLGSGAELSEAELEMLDGITAGTVAASKAVVVDANKDIASFRNVTLTGELDAATGDFSGDVDVDGTLEADAITVNGTALATVIADTTVTTATNANHVSVADNESTNEENLIPFIEDASATGNVGLESDGDFAYNPSTGTVSATVFKGNIDAVDGDFDGTLEADAMTLNGTAITTVATLSTGISNGNLPVFTSGVADDDFLRVNGTSIEGRSASEVLSDIGASAVAGSSSIVTTGALNAGSITSGFGTINTGSSNITSTGVGAFGSLDISGDIDVDGTTNLDVVDIDGAVDMASTLGVAGVVTANAGIKVDNITIDGTEIDLSSGDFTLDVAGEIVLDADGGNFFFNDGGTSIGRLRNVSSDFVISSEVSDKDLLFKGNDGGSSITALTLDMSDAGSAIFNHDILLGDNGIIKLGASADLTIQHDGSNSYIKDEGTGNLYIRTDGTTMNLQAGSDNAVKITKDAQVELFHDNSVKLATASGGAVITGNVATDTLSVGTTSTNGTFTITGSIVARETDGQFEIVSRDTSGSTAADYGDFLFKGQRSTDGDTTTMMKLDGETGDALFSTTDANPADNTGSSRGVVIKGGGNNSAVYIAAYQQSTIIANRLNNDGQIVSLRQNGTEEGNISVSGSTVSFNAFSGSHWSRLTDNSKPTILKGTIVETIDEMCDWYQAQFTVSEQTTKVVEGETVEDEPKLEKKISIALPSGKSVGDTISYTYNDVAYDAVIIKEDDNKHTKCKISDTADSKKVYGVFADWDADDDAVNDMYVTALGTHVVRINKDVTVSAGDLLSSNGDGTAKVQDDDIIRSKTIGKVLTNLKQETYSDGSYTVPCALYCG